MCPELVDPERALRTLRQERPMPAQTEALLKSVHRSSRRSLARPLAFAMTLTALALALTFPPRVPANAAWAQTLANSFDAVPSYSSSRWPSGKLGMEEWRSGVKRAHVLYDRKGMPQMEWRDDGKHLYNFAALMFLNPKAPNSRPWGDVSNSFNPGHETPFGSPEALLKQKGVEVLNHEAASGGNPETYRLRVPLPYRSEKKNDMTVELDGEGRIHRLIGKGEPSGTTIDYPKVIPASVFEPRPQAIPNVDVFSGEETKRIQRGLRQGLGKQGPVTLRAAILTGDGDLWVFWTGALPDPNLARPFAIPGVRCGFAFTNKVYTTAWREAPKMNGVAKATPGPRLGGMARTPLAKLGPTIDLDVPYPGGIARFKKVPYVRIGLIQRASSVLGTPRDFR